ncbi:MAG: glycosyltransferase family 2 protein [Patescibacteria group bacterium]|nr:glycosyltransferase family 2 protein [Patescibacteria group bacterium]
MYISFVVPLYNEAGNLKQLHQELMEVIKQLSQKYKKKSSDFEIIMVDDGSKDQSPEILKSLNPVRILTLRQNSGQTAALDAGFKAARGELVVSLDADLQNDPSSIPDLINKLYEDNLDVVCGWRQDRHDGSAKKFISLGARHLRSFLISDQIHDSGCTLRVYKKSCFEGMTLRGEMHRFIPALLTWRGFKIGELPVKHRARQWGKSKYNMKRTVKGFLDMLTLWFFHKYASRPLHMMGSLGIVSFIIGFGIAIWMLIEKFVFARGIGTRMWPLVAIFLILFGVQVFISGLIMDLIIRSYNPKLYEVKEEHENK